jgi:hypothetical protein
LKEKALKMLRTVSQVVRRERVAASLLPENQNQ